MVQDWYNQNAGKTQLNPFPPNGIPGECVDAAGSWSMFQGGPQFFGSGNDDTAYDIWLTFNHPFYQRVTGNYQVGDIVFLAPNNSGAGTGPEGHVNVLLSLISGGYQAVEANWNGNRGLAINNHSWAGVVGAFRPKGEEVLNKADVDNLLGAMGMPVTQESYGLVGKSFHDAWYYVVQTQQFKDIVAASKLNATDAQNKLNQIKQIIG